MGLMPAPLADGRLIVTPHPVLLDGQRNVPADLRPGESLYAFLARHVDGLDGEAWVVSIGGKEVQRHLWHYCYPKHGQIIEVRSVVGRTVLPLVAALALTYFTFGFGAATAGMWGAGAAAGAWGAAGAAATYVGGSLLINKVLAPKLPGAASSASDNVYSLSSAQNRVRPYEPLGLLFGSIRITPDLASNPYTWYEGDDQYLGMQLTPGLNVHRIGDLYNGDTLLSSYEDVSVWHNGYAGMPSEDIPLYSNADVTAGGELLDASWENNQHTPGEWVQRTSSADTIRLQVDVEMVLYDTTSKGGEKENTEAIQIEYRAVGETAWQAWGTYTLKSRKTTVMRRTWGKTVPQGQYDVRLRAAGLNTVGKGSNCKATWVSLTSIQQDEASYAGIPRTGIKIKGTGQLNGALDEVRHIGYASPLELWDGDAWATVTEPGAAGISNPGGQILQYVRGGYDENGALIWGMGLDDEQIDIEGLKPFMLHCAANGYRYDYWIQGARSHAEVLDTIALAGFGQVTWAGGKLSVVFAAQDQPLGGVVNMATIKRGSFQVDYTLANAADGIEYSYTDPDTLETKTLRVPAPGVTTMLNPAQVSGEGITDETHAARMARWHLAQSLYQFKDIGYSTDLEHLSYRRLSVLALQHDLTQWGYGGRLMAAVDNVGTVTLHLDEPVPAPPTGNAYVGLRIPGEAIYRVFAIVPFAGTSDTITLADEWPDDAALPGNTDDNPAHDTIWIYDIKQTPGYRVRVVGIEPESDLKGASVSVVPEGPEFWTYVLTGEYIPAPNVSLLPTRPVASNIRVAESRVIQGDTVFTELQVTFDVSGYAAHTIVSSDIDGNGQFEEVAQTVTRSATFRIPGAGTYTLLVRPYDGNGNAGVPATLIYTTARAGEPPVLVDAFTVQAIDGGLRRYSWAFDADTIQSPDFTGVEIRYQAGSVATPDWANMSPLGNIDGFHTAAFESTFPAAGTWTFACRSRNTSGTLSTDYRLTSLTLPDNLGEQIEEINDGLADNADAIAQEALERIAADAANAQAIAAEAATRGTEIAGNAQAIADEATARNNAVAAEASARAAALLNEQLTREAQITAEQTARQSDVESLALQISSVSAGTGTQFDSKQIWYFDADREGWWSSNGEPTVIDGWLRAVNGLDAYIISSPGLGISGDAYRFAKLRVRKIGNPSWQGAILWVDGSQNFDVSRMMTIPEPAYNENGIATLEFEDVPWTGNIDQVRFDIPGDDAQTDTDYFLYDWIAIGRPTPGASVAMVQDETLARQAGDATEAAQRTTLAVQLRGDYTGTDASQVTQGLVYSERLARISGDEVNANDILSIQGRLPAGGGAVASSADLTNEASIRAAADAANASETLLLKAALDSSSNPNLQPNSDFTDLSVPTVNQNIGVWDFAFNSPNNDWIPPGVNVFMLHNAASAVQDQNYADVYLLTVQVSDGLERIFSAYGAAHRGRGQLYVLWYDSTGNYLGLSDPATGFFSNTGGGESFSGGGRSLGNWARPFAKVTPPANAYTARIIFRGAGNGGNDPYVWSCRPMVEIARAGQTTPSPWSPSASGAASAQVLQTVIADVSNQGGQLNSQSAQITSLNNGLSATTATANQALNDAANAQATANTKADSSVVAGIQSQVNQQGNDLSSTASNVVGLSNSLAVLGSNASNICTDGRIERYPVGHRYFDSEGSVGIADVYGSGYADMTSVRLVRGPNSAGNVDTSVGEWVTANGQRTYLVEAMIARYNEDPASPGTSWARVGIWWLDAFTGHNWGEAWGGYVSSIQAGAWTKVSGYVTTSAGTRVVRDWLSITGDGNGDRFYVDNIVVRDVTEGYNAQQSANAASTATAALSSEVTSNFNDLTGQISLKANATDVVNLRAELNPGGGNVISNSEFEVDLSGWSDIWKPDPGVNAPIRDLSAPDWLLAGAHSIGGTRPGTPDVTWPHYRGKAAEFPAKPGERWCAAAYCAAHRCGISVGLIFRDASGGVTHENYSNFTSAVGGATLAGYERLAYFQTAPANTTTVEFVYWMVANGYAGVPSGDDPSWWIVKPILTQATADQTVPPAYTPGSRGLDSKFSAATQVLDARTTSVEGQVNSQASQIATVSAGLNGKADVSVTQQMQVDLNWVNGKVDAVWGFQVDANGKIAAMRAASNGSTSAIDFLSDVLRWSAPAGGGVEFQNNRISVRNSSGVAIVELGQLS